MTYVAWAARYEGASDRAYFDVLIPRVMEEITLEYGTRNSTIPPFPSVVLQRQTTNEIAAQACAAREAFHIVFIHSDTGGRNLEQGVRDRSCAICEAMAERCAWPPERCVVVTPRQETEAWILADRSAVALALGYTGVPQDIGLPPDGTNVEGIADPKATLTAVAREVRGRRRPFDVRQLYSSIAQRQSMAMLRRVESYHQFETRLMTALESIGCLDHELPG